jgi:pimeloyl-ACP methyl ester carboxylesterase
MPPHRSILWYLSLTLAVLYLLGTVFGGIGLGEIALHPASPPISQSEERNAEASAQQNSVEFRDVELVTQDGVSLRAWFMRPREANGNTVILLHGVSDNRLGMYGYGRWLLQNHYSVLLPDARHHGNSGGLTTYGIREANELVTQDDVLEKPARRVL